MINQAYEPATPDQSPDLEREIFSQAHQKQPVLPAWDMERWASRSEQEWARGKEAEARKWPKGLRKIKRPRGPKSSSPCLCLLECKLEHPRAALLQGTNSSEGLLGQLLVWICLEH